MQIEKQSSEPQAMNATAEAQLEALMERERVARQNNDQKVSTQVATEIMALLRQNAHPLRLISAVKILTSKRGQMTSTTSLVVKECMTMIDGITDDKIKIAFVNELKAICDKKIYLEVDFARCAMILVRFNESGADLQEAARIMDNVQVETYGSMTKKEKLEFILYQMRIQYLLNDMTRLFIVGRKVNLKTLEEEGFHLIKIGYYLYLFHIHLNAKDFDSASGALEKVHEGLLKCSGSDEFNQLDSVILTNFAIFLDKTALSEAVLLFKCLKDHTVEKAAEIEALKSRFEVYLAAANPILAIAQSFIFKELTSCNIQSYRPTDLIFLSARYPAHALLVEALSKQLVRKNLHIVSLYFKDASLNRLAGLLETSYEAVEENLCELILRNIVKGRIDRPRKVVIFNADASDVEVIDKWVANINDIVDIIDFACERIEREEVKVK